MAEESAGGLMALLSKDKGADLGESDVGTLSAEEGPEGTQDGPSPEFEMAADQALVAIQSGDKPGFADALFHCMSMMK